MMKNIKSGDIVLISHEYLSRNSNYPYNPLRVIDIKNNIIKGLYMGAEFYFPIQEAIKVNKQ